jgi:DNA-3-methyladenine glycosylase II
MAARTTPSRRFEIAAQGPFDFSESARFWQGFTLANAGEGTGEEKIDLAFVPPGAEQAIGARVTGVPGGIAVEIYGEAPESIEADLARIFSLDVDGRGFESLAERDPELEPLLESFNFARPVLFPTPFEAACWSVISQRVRMTQAAKVKANMERELGEAVQFPNRVLYAFPAPSTIAKLGPFPGLMNAKVDRLRGLAEQADVLDPERLRSLPDEIADQDVLALPGIGPFSAELILLRGVGFPDRLPLTGSHMNEGIARLYRLHAIPGEAEVREIAESWRPFRGWVAFLLHRLVREGAME